MNARKFLVLVEMLNARDNGKTVYWMAKNIEGLKLRSAYTWMKEAENMEKAFKGRANV